jgi:hypothetical protein
MQISRRSHRALDVEANHAALQPIGPSAGGADQNDVALDGLRRIGVLPTKM